MTEIQLEKMYQAWYQDFKKLGLKKNIKSYSDGREKFSLRKKINGRKGKQSSNFFSQFLSLFIFFYFSISVFISFFLLIFLLFIISFSISVFSFCLSFLYSIFFLSVALTGPRPVVI